MAETFKLPKDWNQPYVDEAAPWDTGVPSELLQRVLRDHAIEPTRTLEIGCGTGTNAIFLAQQGFSVTAVDVAPLAIEQAKQKAAAAGVDVDFRVVDLLQPGAAAELTGGTPYSFVFDRGVYHCLRKENLEAFLGTMKDIFTPDAIYVALAGNAEDDQPLDLGPPQVHAHELASELHPLFRLIELRECRFGGVVIDGASVEPLAWTAVLRRRAD